MLRGESLGRGTFGIVYSAQSPNSGKEYAIKRNMTDNETSFIGAPREVDILHQMKKHPHIVHLEMVCFGSPFQNGVFSPLAQELLKGGRRDDSMHFGFNKAVYDLHSFIYGAVTINFTLMKRYMVQMLLGLEYLHGHKYIHRDLKPANILIFGDQFDILGQGNIAQICDFGLAKPYTYQGQQTPGTITCYWRAPEVALGYPNYDYKCDIWSLGCIFFEMIAKQSFITVDNDDDDFIISTILGNLPQELPLRKLRDWVKNCKWKDVKLSPVHKPKTRKSWLQQLALSDSGKKQFEEEAGKLSDFCDLLDNMIRFDCNDRYDVTRCLYHPFFADYQEYIKLTREKFPPTEKCTTPLYVHQCIERRWMAEEVINIFNSRAERSSWYSHRALFQAMDIFDRYLYVMGTSVQAQPNAVESDVKGLIHTKEETRLRFYICLYLAVKYFSSVHLPVEFSTVAPAEFLSQENLLKGEQFESALVVNCLAYSIYKPTVYESADIFLDKLDDNDVRDLIILYTMNSSVKDITAEELYTYYRNRLRGKSIQEILSPIVKEADVLASKVIPNPVVKPGRPNKKKIPIPTNLPTENKKDLLFSLTTLF